MATFKSHLPAHTKLQMPRIKDGKKYTALAPYNFVPLPQDIVLSEYENTSDIPDHDTYKANTGWIECELETLTHLYVRGMQTYSDFQEFGDTAFYELDAEHKTRRAGFFNVAGNPVIPGSSLRGMIRALVEIVGYGKVSTVSAKQMIFRAVGDPSSLGQYYRAHVLGENKAALPNNHFDYPSLRLRGGYLKRQENGWAIQPAMEYFDESFVHVSYEDARQAGIAPSSTHNHIQETFEVYVKPEKRRISNRGRRGSGDLVLDVAVASAIDVAQRRSAPPTGMVQATLVISGHMGGGHPKHWHCAIYAPDPFAKLIQISENLWQSYSEDRDMSRGIKTRKIEEDGDALFYLTNAKNQLVFWGPTQMFRLPFGKSALDFVPEWLRKEGDVDLAEAIFGYVKSTKMQYGKERSYAGRVFVEDAKVLPNQGSILEDEVFTPKILASPKPSTFQHYLVQTDEGARQKLFLRHYADSTPEATVLRGHKLYWHRKFNSLNDMKWHGTGRKPESQEREEAKKQLTSIRPVCPNKKFGFRVHFENLSDVELGALLWVLELPEGCAHKLGMGKPLGLGSVRISVKEVVLTNRQERYSHLWQDDRWAQGLQIAKPTQDYIRAFENYVLNKMDHSERGNATRLAELHRINELLCMLSFSNAPETDKTRYLEIERLEDERGNEYKERPVLALPSTISWQPGISTENHLPATNAPKKPALNHEQGVAPNWRKGSIAEIRPDKRYGKVRDMENNLIYRFDTNVIQGDMPANRATVVFDLQGEAVRNLKRR